MTLSTPPGGDSGTGRLLWRGAEADIVADEWQGLEAVFKIRRRLEYRLSVLDDAIRLQRTVHEAQMIHAAREAGIPVPGLYYVDPGEATIVMERVAGQRVKDFVGRASPDDLGSLFHRIGADVAGMHAANITHGDLTTANMIRREGRVVYVDFGLSTHSTRVEDRAVDLRLAKETVLGAHSERSDAALKALTEGYESEAGAQCARAVMAQLRSIERRGRYARVV